MTAHNIQVSSTRGGAAGLVTLFRIPFSRSPERIKGPALESTNTFILLCLCKTPSDLTLRHHRSTLVRESEYQSSCSLLKMISMDFVAHARQAIDSPSPLVRLLDDPTLFPKTSKRDMKRKGRSPDHRSTIVAELALKEEERQAIHLKSLLRTSTNQLEEEMRRAEEANMRADFAECREKATASRLQTVESERDQARRDSNRFQRDLNNYQMQLEEALRQVHLLQTELEEVGRDFEEMDRHSRTTAQLQDASMQAIETQIRRREEDWQKSLDEAFENGRADGCAAGYQTGYEAGRRHGIKETTKKMKHERRAQRQAYEQGLDQRTEYRGNDVSFKRAVLISY